MGPTPAAAANGLIAHPDGAIGSTGADLPLGSLGLTQLEIRVYRTLVALRESTRDDLLVRLGLTAEETDRTATALTARGLVTTTDDEPPRLIAAPPEVAGEVLLLRRMEELQTARLAFAQLAEEYRAGLNKGTVDELIEVVPVEAVPKLNDQLNSRAEREVLWVNAPPYLAPIATYVTELDRLAAGVRYRCIYARSLLDEPGSLDMIRRDVEAGEQARVIDTVPLKMGIVDRQVALLPLLTGMSSSAAGWLLVHPCSLLDALVALFETMWLTALPLDRLVASNGVPVSANGSGQHGAGASGDLASEEARLLTLLLAGMTDEAIARQLGIGKRTVLRRVRQLMDRGGVSTRIQLGWAASQLGWLAAPPARPGRPGQAGPPADTP